MGNEIKLFNGDCIEVMETLPDKSIDLILCDLPYGTTKNKWDNVIDMEKMWNEYNRIIKENGAILLFCDGLFMARLMLSQEKMWRYNLIWEKQQGCDFLNANRKPLKAHEEIAVFYKEMPKFNKQYWLSNPYKKTVAGSKSENYGEYHLSASESKDGKRCPLSVIKFNYDTTNIHPTQKPVALCRWLIETYTDAGDTVLDNCMGSGSTGVACVNVGRKFIGIELDSKYYNIAKQRIETAERPLFL
jgi:site-specific DNA-methyltransferase (adenine-specific)